MTTTWRDVLAGSAPWSCEPSEAMAFLRGLPSRSVALVLFSPPYEDARTYGVGFRHRGQDWVDWLRPIVVEAARVSDGLVAVNAAGKVGGRKGVNHRYSGAVEFLVADLLRLDGLVCGPSPYAWVRDGIPGSGSKRSGYHRRNWEPVYCFALPDRLPLWWHDQTAFGHPPKWAPGGEFSHRLSNGERVNQWGRVGGGESGGSRGKDGKQQRKLRPSHRPTTKNAFGVNTNGAGNRRSQADGERITKRMTPRDMNKGGAVVEQQYAPPVIANPGNVIYTPNGGNKMGHKLAHENEAPMNLALAERFVRWYAPPGAVVLDPFSGSGTTAHAALAHGRRFVGCDVRESQCDLTARRLATVVPNHTAGA